MTDRQLIETLANDVVVGARALIGATLVRDLRSAKIVETEAYRHDDPGAHSFGKTAMKNMAMFGEPGTAYIYKCYGCHWMLNVVAGNLGCACAVLIRAAEPLSGLETMRTLRRAKSDRQLLSGPGRLALAFDVGPDLNGQPVIGPGAGELRIVARTSEPRLIVAAPRIGIAQGKWHEVPWRFVDQDSAAWASAKVPG